MKKLFILGSLFVFLFGLSMVSAGECNDGSDNDGDGYIDYSGGDVGCSQTGDLSEIYDCSDGIDNDLDGIIDFRGSCKSSSGVYVSCTDAPSTCQNACIAAGSMFYGPDVSCFSFEDESEDSRTAGTTTSSSPTTPTISTPKSSSSWRIRLGAAEYESGSSLPWVLGALGVLLIGGAAYWFFTKKNVGKKAKKK